MNFEEINLKLFLDDIGISHSNKTLSDRIAIQKAVFIGQCAGLNFGFHYSWYEYGPYSRDLTPVYYRFNRNYADNERDYENCSLKGVIKDRISEFIALLAPPDEFNPDTLENNKKIERKSAWLEFIASILYLMEEYNNDVTEVKIRLMNSNKKRYCKYYNLAIEKIKEVNLFKEKYYPEESSSSISG